MNMQNYEVVSPPLTGTTFHDPTTANSAHFYRVRSVNGTGAIAPRSDGSAYDMATTVMFSALGPQPGVRVQVSHFTNELRPAVNAVRFLARQSAAIFSNDLASGYPIRAVHITELRTGSAEWRRRRPRRTMRCG